MTFKDVIRLVTPPFIIELAKRLQGNGRSGSEWEYIPEGWAYAESHPEVTGWNVQGILETYRKKWPNFEALVQGTAPLGVSHESDLTTNLDIASHNTVMSFGYVLALASRKRERVSMLDWGGGIGHYYLLSQVLQPGTQMEYHCKDMPALCDYGKQRFPGQSFCSDESCLDGVYDLVMASTSMHYTQDWQTLLHRLAGATSGYLYIANLPVVQQASSFVFLQRPYRYGYNTEYLGWCLNQSEFLHEASLAGLVLQREFVYGHQPVIHGAPEQNSYRGYLFKPLSKG